MDRVRRQLFGDSSGWRTVTSRRLVASASVARRGQIDGHAARVVVRHFAGRGINSFVAAHGLVLNGRGRWRSPGRLLRLLHAGATRDYRGRAYQALATKSACPKRGTLPETAQLLPPLATAKISAHEFCNARIRADTQSLPDYA